MYVHLDTGLGWLTGRPCLPRHIVNRLTCDAKLRPVWHTDGVPVSVGRAQRTVPRHTRRLVLDRDRGCRFPGCGSTGHLEVHHIVHWILGGLTDLDNLVALCPRHHAAHHRGEFTIAGDPNLPDADPADDPRPGERSGLRFTTANGLPVRYTAPAATRGLLPGGPAYAGPSGDRLESHWVTFDARAGTVADTKNFGPRPHRGGNRGGSRAASGPSRDAYAAGPADSSETELAWPRSGAEPPRRPIDSALSDLPSSYSAPTTPWWKTESVAPLADACDPTDSQHQPDQADQADQADQPDRPNVVIPPWMEPDSAFMRKVRSRLAADTGAA